MPLSGPFLFYQCFDAFCAEFRFFSVNGFGLNVGVKSSFSGDVGMASRIAFSGGFSALRAGSCRHRKNLKRLI